MHLRSPVLALVAALALAPTAARAGMPVGMYPFRVPGLPTAQRTDLHQLLEAALSSASRRGILVPRSPALLSASCGESPSGACLGTLARDGLVLAGRGEMRAGVLLVTAALWDRNGNRTREVRFVVDLVIQNLRPVNEALLEMEVEIEPDGTVFGSKTAPPPARDPRGPAPAVAAAPPPAPPTPPAPPPAKPAAAASAPAPAAPKPPPAATAPAPIDVAAPAAKSSAWKRQAGPLFTFVGAAVVVAGGAVALGAGTYIWITAPPSGKGASAGAGGKF